MYEGCCGLTIPLGGLCGPLGLAAGVVPRGTGILGTSLLSQLSALGAASLALALAAHAPKGGKGAGLGRYRGAGLA